MGIAPGEVVSYMLPNGVAAASVFLGAMYGGYVVSPMSLLAQDALIEHTLAHSETRIVFAAPEFVDAAHVDRRADRQPRDRAADLARRSRIAAGRRAGAAGHARPPTRRRC